MSVRVKVELDQGKLKRLNRTHIKALEITAEAVLSDIKTSAVVPKDTGELERSGFVDISEIQNTIVKIIFDTPYARRLYYHPEYNFRTDKNPNAQGKWMEMYLQGDKEKFIKQTYATVFKQLNKGVIK